MAMEDPQEEVKATIVKIALYVGGTILGLAAKLAAVNKLGKLTWKQSAYHSLVAFACSFFVWHLLKYNDKLEIANIASVIVGRFGDLILVAVWKGIKDLITKKIKE